jgi:phage terminase small subunit
MPKGDKLTAKQQAFVTAYLKSRSPAKAYRAAYAPAKMTDAMCNTEGCRLLNHPTIARLMSEAERQATERVAADLSITKERHLREYARLAYGTLKGIAEFNDDGEVTFTASNELTDDQWAMISGIEKVVSPKGAESTKLKTHSKQAALDSISKVMGWFGPEASGPGANSAPLNLTIHIDPPGKA